MKRGLEAFALLLICCEGNSKNLTEQNYFNQLKRFVKNNKPNFIKFNEIDFIKRDISEIFNIKKLLNYLEARGYKEKYSFIAIWKDNDDNDNVKKENVKLLSLKSNIFKNLRKYLIEDRKNKENCDIWLLPESWNFEEFYRNHLSEQLNISNKEIKEKCINEFDHFINKLFNEENFRNIAYKLKEFNSNIDLFVFEN